MFYIGLGFVRFCSSCNAFLGGEKNIKHNFPNKFFGFTTTNYLSKENQLIILSNITSVLSRGASSATITQLTPSQNLKAKASL